MDLADVVPWPWCAAALVAALRARRGGRGWWSTAAFALLLASLHLWRWNQPVYEAGRQLLIDCGVHGDRLVFKLALGLVFVPVFAFFAWRAWHRSRRLAMLHRVALLLMVADALYVTMRTLSIDGWMPIALGVEPGKSILGISLAVLAALAVAFAGAPPVQEFDDAS